MNRILNPSLNPAGLSSAVLALYALGTGIWNVAHHAGAVDPQVIVAAVAAVAALFTRQVVTPVADPKDGAFRPLMPVSTVNVSGHDLAKIARSLVPPVGYPLDRPPTVVENPPAPEPQPEPARPVSSDPRERSAL